MLRTRKRTLIATVAVVGLTTAAVIVADINDWFREPPLSDPSPALGEKSDWAQRPADDFGTASSSDPSPELGDKFDWGQLPADDSGARWVSVLTPSGCDELSDEDLAHLDRFRPIVELRLGGQSRISDAGLRHVGRITELEVFRLDLAQVTDDGIRHLRVLDRLKELRLNMTKVKGPGIQSLSGLGALEILELNDCDLRELSLRDGFRSLERIRAWDNQNLAHIRIARLRHLRSIEASSLAPLRSLALDNLWSLESVSLSFGDPPRGAGADEATASLNETLAEFEFAGANIKINHLWLRVPLTDWHIEKLPSLPSLKALVLLHPANTISDNSLARIAKFSKLETLQISGNIRGDGSRYITDDGLRNLRSLWKLKRLSLEGLAIDGRGLEWLTALPELEELSLRATQVSVGEAKKWLPRMRALRRIDLSHVPDQEAIYEEVVETLPCLEEADLTARFEGAGKSYGHAYLGE